MEVEFKKTLKGAPTPAYANPGDACFDLAVLFDRNNPPESWCGDDVAPISFVRMEGGQIPVYKGESVVFRTGLAFEVPPGHVMLIFPRSSAGIKLKLVLTNGTGVIDSGYRGEVRLAVMNSGKSTVYISNGQRLAQAMIVPYPTVELVEASELSGSERGTDGIGSSGK